MAANPNDPTAATGVFAPNPHPLAGADSVPAEPQQPQQSQQPVDHAEDALPQNHPKAIKKTPDNYVERLTTLKQVHPWMPPQTAAVLAGTQASDKAVVDMADDLRKQYSTVDNAIKYVTDDPVLQKAPSLALSIRSYLTNTIGSSPIADSDLPHIQKSLQAQGFGKNLPANGEWNQAWNQAFSTWSDNLRSQALGGKQPGSITVSQGLDALNQVMPVPAATSLGAAIMHIPDGVAQDIHTAAGAIAGGANALYQGFQPKNLLNPNFTPNRKEERGVEATAENASTAGLGGHVTPQTAFSAQGGRTQAMDVLQVAGDLLATHGLLKAGSAVADAAAATKWTKLDAEAAQRGPGTIAKKFFGPVAEGDNTGKPLLSRGAAENVPMVRMAGPVADKIAGANGYYYRARTLLAAPYAVPGVKAAGTAVGQLGLAGAKVRGLATAESVVGGQTSPNSQAINNFDYVNQANDAINNRLKFTAFGHHFTLGLNDLAVVLHPDLDTGATGTVSASVGKDVTGLNESMKRALGPDTGFGISIERGVNWTSKHSNPYIKLDKMVEAAGGEANFNQFWFNRIMDHAATALAERDYAAMDPEEQVERGTPDGAKFSDKNVALKDIADEYRSNAVKTGDYTELFDSARNLISNDHAGPGQWGGHNDLAHRIAAEIDRSGVSPQEFLKGNVNNHAEGSKIMRNDLVPRQAEFLHDGTPDGSLGMAKLDYKTSETAHSEINKLEDSYKKAQEAVQAALNGEPPSAGEEGNTAFQEADAALSEYMKNTPKDDIDIDHMRTLDKARRDAQAAQHEVASPKGQDPTVVLAQAAEAIRQYLEDNWAIDGHHMPQSDEDMFTLAREKADGQAHAVYPRSRANPTEPEDEQPHLKENRPAGPSTLERHTTNPVFSKMTPSEAVEFIHEGDDEHQLYPFTNDRREIERGAGHTLTPGASVTIEHEPESLYGNDTSADYTETGEAPAFDKLRSEARGVGSFEAERQGVTGLNGVRSVEFGKIATGKEGSEQQWLEHQLEDAGYVKFDKPGGGVKYVRPGLTGGKIATSPQAAAAMAKLKELGYKPVIGKGIGFDFFDSPKFDVLDSKMTARRRFVENLGLDPTNIPSSDIGFTWNMNFNRNLQDIADKDPKFLYPTHTVQTVVAMLHDRDAIPETTTTASLIQHTIGSKAYNNNLALRTQEAMGHGLSETEARVQEARRMSQELNNPGGLAHVTEKDLKNALKDTPKEGSQTYRSAEIRGVDTQKSMYSDDQIKQIYRAIQKTNMQQPTRLVGWQRAENLAAYGLSYGGKKLTGGKAWLPEYLPTRLVTLRNRARFTLSPEFAARRVVKVNMKIALDNVSPTFFPLRELEKAGQEGAKASWARLDRIMPEYANSHYDDGMQIQYADDPWGIYPHKNYEAYAAREWAKQGKTDTEIRSLLIKDFSYGSEAYGEGRSALERSGNFVFFPLSFDKTLYRNTGAYLLDHTAQRLVLQAGLQMYANYNASDPNGNKLMSSNWWQNHAPVINEALRLNAFAHGIGLGEFGGINAPLLNLVIPQSYASSSQGVTLLKGIAPIVKEFQQVTSEFGQTWNVGLQLGEDQFKNNPTLQGIGPKDMPEAEKLQAIFQASPVAETSTAQLYQAYQYRRQVTALLKGQIDYNAHADAADKLTLGKNASLFGNYTGEVIDATLVNNLVHQKFPAFAPSDPETYYATQAATINAYSQRMKGAGHDDVVDWIDKAQTYGNAIYDGNVDTSSAAQGTKVYRQYAVKYAETIPGFLDFYNKNFLWQYGPLEGVR